MTIRLVQGWRRMRAEQAALVIEVLGDYPQGLTQKQIQHESGRWLSVKPILGRLLVAGWLTVRRDPRDDDPGRYVYAINDDTVALPRRRHPSS